VRNFWRSGEDRNPKREGEKRGQNIQLCLQNSNNLYLRVRDVHPELIDISTWPECLSILQVVDDMFKRVERGRRVLGGVIP
jgi:hypothetical protein